MAAKNDFIRLISYYRFVLIHNQEIFKFKFRTEGKWKELLLCKEGSKRDGVRRSFTNCGLENAESHVLTQTNRHLNRLKLSGPFCRIPKISKGRRIECREVIQNCPKYLDKRIMGCRSCQEWFTKSGSASLEQNHHICVNKLAIIALTVSWNLSLAFDLERERNG